MKLNTIIIVLALATTSCAKDDISFFDAPTAVAFQYLGGKTVKYTFLTNPDLPFYNYSVPVKISGTTADYDREVKVSVLADSTTATSSDYEILGGSVKANEYMGYVVVKFMNRDILKTETLRLWLTIETSKDLIKGNIENESFELLWENRIAEPANWKYYGFGTYSTTVYKFMIETLGISYIEYGYPDDPNVPNISYLLLGAYQAKMRTALKEYNKANPKAPLTHKDGAKKDELVVIP